MLERNAILDTAGDSANIQEFVISEVMLFSAPPCKPSAMAPKERGSGRLVRDSNQLLHYVQSPLRARTGPKLNNILQNSHLPPKIVFNQT